MREVSMTIPTIDSLLQENDTGESKAYRVGLITGHILSGLYKELKANGVPVDTIYVLLSDTITKVSFSLMTCPNSDVELNNLKQQALVNHLDQYQFPKDAKPN